MHNLCESLLALHVCACVCMCVCVYVCVHVCMYVCVYVCVCGGLTMSRNKVRLQRQEAASILVGEAGPGRVVVVAA